MIGRGKKADTDLTNLVYIILVLVFIIISLAIGKYVWEYMTKTTYEGGVLYYYMEDKQFKNPEEKWFTRGTGFITFVKSGREISVKQDLSLDALSCPDVSTSSDISSKKIMVDPAFGGSETGFTKSITRPDKSIAQLKESDLTRFTALNLKLALKESALLSTRNLEKDEAKTIEERKAIINDKKPDLFISLHIGQDADADKNEIRVYYSKDSKKENESRKLGCILINEFVKNKKLEDIDFTVTEPIKDQKEILPNNIPAIYIEIGNIDNFYGQELLQRNELIAESIYDGVKSYYQVPGTATFATGAFDLPGYTSCKGTEKFSKASGGFCGDAAGISRTIVAPEGESHLKQICPIADTTKYTREQIKGLIKAEVRRQFSDDELRARGTDIEHAYAAALSYACHESDMTQFVDNKPSIDSPTYPCVVGVYQVNLRDRAETLNEAYLIAWDTKYNIYWGVREIKERFSTHPKVKNVKGEQVWKYTLAYNFLPGASSSQVESFWSGGNRANKRWYDQYLSTGDVKC